MTTWMVVHSSILYLNGYIMDYTLNILKRQLKMTETDFINMYIEKLQGAMHELQSKNVLLDTKLTLAEKQVILLQKQIEAMEEREAAFQASKKSKTL